MKLLMCLLATSIYANTNISDDLFLKEKEINLSMETFLDIEKPEDTSTSFLEKKTSIGETRLDFMQRDLILAGASIANFVRLVHQDRSFTKWKEGRYKEQAWDNFKESWSKPPKWDRDPWAINYVAHPLNGALYYQYTREKGYSAWKSFTYAAYKSTFWEYGIEATMERPSIQDLVVTPVSGFLIGEGSHYLTKKMRKNGLNTLEKVLVTIINPMNVIYHGYH